MYTLQNNESKTGEQSTTSANEDPYASEATPTILAAVRSATSPVIPRMNPVEEPSRHPPVDSSQRRPRITDADSVIGNVGRSYFAQLAASQVKASTHKMYKTVFLSLSSKVLVKVEGSVGVIVAYNRPRAKITIKLSGAVKIAVE